MTSSRGLSIAALALLLASGCESGHDAELTVVISVPEQHVSGAARATLVVDYSGAGAGIVDEDGVPACAFILPGVEGDFADDGQGTLTIHATGARAMRGPADIAACRMLPSDPETTSADLRGKLLVRLSGAEDAAGKPVDVTAAARGPKGSPERSEKAVEEAQEAAVKAAASIAPPPPAPAPGTAGAAAPGAAPATGAAGSVTASGGVVAGAAAAPAPGARPGASPADKSAAAKPTAARPVTPASIARPGAPAPGEPVDQGAPAVPNDRDRNYDDSPSDDATAPAYDLTIAVQGGGRLGALQIEINHLGSSGGFIGRGDKVDCVSLVEAIVASNYVGERQAKIGLISLAGIPSPANVVRCGFRTREMLSPMSFQITVADAADPDSQPIEPLPTVVVTNVMRR